jgi:hypothetical protein
MWQQLGVPPVLLNLIKGILNKKKTDQKTKKKGGKRR